MFNMHDLITYILSWFLYSVKKDIDIQCIMDKQTNKNPFILEIYENKWCNSYS